MFGTCIKCGKVKEVRHHHFKGYLGENKDNVVLYCFSCDKKAHAIARKTGKCKLTSTQTRRLGATSYARRNPKRYLTFNEKLVRGIFLHEQIKYIESINHLSYDSDIIIRR